MKIIACKKCNHPCAYNVSGAGTFSLCCNAPTYIKDVSAPEIGKAARSMNKAALAVLAVALIAVIYLLYLVFALHTVTNRPSRVISTAEKIRVERLLAKHGLRGQVSIIEILQDGSMWFERDGVKYRLQ